MTRFFSGRSALAVGAAALAAASIAACGSGSAAGSAATSAGPASAPGAQATVQAAAPTGALHACSLLSATQAAATVGFHYSSATESGGQMCSYKTTDAPIPLFIIVSPGAGSAAWSDQLQTLQEDCGADAIKLTGAGQQAAGCGTEIGVQAGGYIIDVHGGDPSGTGNAFPKSIALARVIIGALHAG